MEQLVLENDGSYSKEYKKNLVEAINKAYQHPRKCKGSNSSLMAARLKGKNYVCSICDHGFKTKSNLINHVYSHAGFKPWTCNFCSKSFTASALLLRHIRYIHTKEKRYKCNECGKRFVESSKLKQHYRVHTGERPYPCPHCSYASKYYPGWKRHVFTHTGAKPYPCDICNKRFTVKHSMILHRLSHTGDIKKVSCKFCPSKFTRDFYLKIHTAHMHSKNEVYSCEICHKKLFSRYSWKCHKNSHKGEKVYKCNICDRSFMSLKARETHMNIHTNTLPFKCMYCNQGFRQMQSLKRHQKLYHDTETITSVNLLTVQHRKEGFQCSMCSKTYKRMGNLEKHLLNHNIAKINGNRYSLRSGTKVLEQSNKSKSKGPRCLVKRTKLANRHRSIDKPSSILTGMKLRSTLDRLKKRCQFFQKKKLISEISDNNVKESHGDTIDTANIPPWVTTYADISICNIKKCDETTTDVIDESVNASESSLDNKKNNHVMPSCSVINDVSMQSKVSIFKLKKEIDYKDYYIKEEITNNFGFELDDEIEMKSTQGNDVDSGYDSLRLDTEENLVNDLEVEIYDNAEMKAREANEVNSKYAGLEFDSKEELRKELKRIKSKQIKQEYGIKCK